MDKAQKVSPINAKKNTVKLAEMFSKTTHCKFFIRAFTLRLHTKALVVYRPVVTRHEAESLLRIYYSLNNGRYDVRLDRAKFRDVLHNTFNITDDMLMDRVFKAFDRDNDGAVSREEWLVGLSVLLRGTIDEKMKCKYGVHIAIVVTRVVLKSTCVVFRLFRGV